MYLGIDIASVDENKPVDWAKAKAAGIRFAIFRGTYIQWADPTWKLEADRARAAGLTVGAYLFPVMDKTAPSAQAQVDAFAAAVKLTAKDLPPILDVEFPKGILKTGRSRLQLLEWVREAVAVLKKAYRVAPIIYTSARVWDGEDADSLDVDGLGVPTPELLECPLWLARYVWGTRVAPHLDAGTLALPPVPKAWGDSTNVWIHQYQGDSKGLPGFTSLADLNRFFELKLGAKGERVKWLQRKLRAPVDGDFGPVTAKYLADFQRANGLDPDSEVGVKTFAVLCWVIQS